MAEEIQHTTVPFDPDLGAPQRQIFYFEGLTVQAIWYRNSYDDTLTLRLNDFTNLSTFIITKLAPSGVYAAMDSDGGFLFGIFAHRVDLNDPDVWLMTIEDMNLMGRLDE